jgi:hypothetical protein
MYILVRTLTGKKIIIKIDSNTTIRQIMEKIKEKEGIDIENQRLIGFGKELDSDKTVKDYKLTEQTLIHLIITK